jgi:small subunit ribosomal protein S16
VSVKIRLRVVGKRKQHSYRIVAIESRNPRDGKYLEQLGWYDPRSKELQVDEEGIKRWQGKGAVLSDAVKALLRRTDEEVSASKSAKASKKASKRKSKKQSMKDAAEGSTKEATEESAEEKTDAKDEKSTEENAEESTDTGKTEEVNDVEGTDNVHSEVSGGST